MSMLIMQITTKHTNGNLSPALKWTNTDDDVDIDDEETRVTLPTVLTTSTYVVELISLFKISQNFSSGKRIFEF